MKTNWIKEVDKLYRDVSKDNDIEKLNDYIFKKFKSKEIIGISLKQVTCYQKGQCTKDTS